jgi:hypothetical protein
MTPPSKSPWQSELNHTDTPVHLDMTPKGILERDRAISDGIRQGIIVPNFAMQCRAAVAAGIASGVVVPPQSSKALGGNTGVQETGSESDTRGGWGKS